LTVQKLFQGNKQRSPACKVIYGLFGLNIIQYSNRVLFKNSETHIQPAIYPNKNPDLNILIFKFPYSNAMIISIITNINFHNTNHYTQLFIQSNHFLTLKNIFFQSQKFNTNHYTLLFIQFNHFLPLKNIFFQYKKNSTPKHKFIKNLNSIQHPNTFLLSRNLQTNSEYYSYSKNSTPKRTNNSSSL
jgi:hypothetical protein